LMIHQKNAENNKTKTMGKLLVKLGLKIQAWWCLFECWWNSIVAKLMFNVETCPHKLCKCKK